MCQKHYHNSRKCNLTSTLSGCIQGHKCKTIIALSTSFPRMDIFEKV